MLIDIILLCYNQERYIKQALDSIFIQEFPEGVSGRIIVADDNSFDNTLNIIHKSSDYFSTSSPQIEWFYLPKEANMGIAKNYQRSFNTICGRYVFIIEGDDYWLPGHIIQHVKFLEEHNECSMSMNRISFLQEKTGVFNAGNELTEDYQLVTLKKQISEGNQLGNLSACCFRGKLLREIPAHFYDMIIADWMLGIIMGEKGYLAILNKTTSVYRFKDDGWWAGMSPAEQLRETLKDAKIYDKYQNRKYHDYWKEFRHNTLRDAKRNWMHFTPEVVRHLIHSFSHRIKKCQKNK